MMKRVIASKTMLLVKKYGIVMRVITALQPRIVRLRPIARIGLENIEPIMSPKTARAVKSMLYLAA